MSPNIRCMGKNWTFQKHKGFEIIYLNIYSYELFRMEFSGKGIKPLPEKLS